MGVRWEKRRIFDDYSTVGVLCRKMLGKDLLEFELFLRSISISLLKKYHVKRESLHIDNFYSILYVTGYKP